jgi:hypothetical protein
LILIAHIRSSPTLLIERLTLLTRVTVYTQSDTLGQGLQAIKAEWKRMSEQIEIRPETSEALERYSVTRENHEVRAR